MLQLCHCLPVTYVSTLPIIFLFFSCSSGPIFPVICRPTAPKQIHCKRECVIYVESIYIQSVETPNTSVRMSHTKKGDSSQAGLHPLRILKSASPKSYRSTAEKEGPSRPVQPGEEIQNEILPARTPSSACKANSALLICQSSKQREDFASTRDLALFFPHHSQTRFTSVNLGMDKEGWSLLRHWNTCRMEKWKSV